MIMAAADAILLIVPAAGAAVLVLFAAYAAYLALRAKAAAGSGDFEGAMGFERKLAGLLRLKSFSDRRLLLLHLRAGSKSPEALSLYETALDRAPDKKAAAAGVAALLRREDLETSGALCRKVFGYLYAEGARTPLVWEMVKEIALADGDRDRAASVLHEWMSELPQKDVCLELRDLLLEREDAGPEAEAVYMESLKYEDHQETVLRLLSILEHRWDTSDASLPAYRKALEIDPEHEWANAAVAEILERSGSRREVIPHYVRSRQYAKALEALMQAFGPKPSDPIALRWMCEIVMRQEKTDQHSLAVCHLFLRTCGDDSRTLKYLFDVYAERRERHDEALRVFEAYRRRVPDDPRGLTTLAKAYRDTGRIRDAIWLFEEGVEEFAGDLGVLRDLAKTVRRHEVRSGRAVLDMIEYLDREWDDDVASYLRGVCLNGEADPAVAGRVFKRILENNPSDADALKALARIHLDNRNTVDGIEAFLRLIELGIEQPWVTRGMADLYAISHSRGESAEKTYLKAVNAGIAGDGVILALASMNMERGRKDGFAVEMVRRASRLPGCPPAVRVYLAQIYYDSGMFDMAAAACREVLAEDQGNIEAERWLGKSLARSGTDAEACEALEKVHAEMPGDLGVVAELAEAYVAAGAADGKSLAVYDEFLAAAAGGAVKADPGTVLGVRRSAGVACFASGRADRGFEILAGLYRESPEHAKALAASAARLVEADPAHAEKLLAVALEAGDMGFAHGIAMEHLRRNPGRADAVVDFLRKTRKSRPEALGQTMDVLEDMHSSGHCTVRLLSELGTCNLMSGDVEMASRRWRMILSITHDPRREGPPYSPAGAEARQALSDSDSSKLLARMLRLVKAGSANESVLFSAGRLYLRKEDPARAASALEKAVGKAPGDREIAHFLKAAYKAMLGRKPAADPVREKLAGLLASEENWDEAIVEYQRMSPEYFQSKQIAVKLAACFIGKGHPTVACRELEKALAGSEISKDSMEVHYTLAKAYQAAGETDKARLTLERIGFVDYNYRDVRQRLDDLSRSAPAAAEAKAPSAPRVTIGDFETGEFQAPAARGERFEILEIRGRGGMATVYKALDREYDPPLTVALKVLPDEFVRSEKAVRLFKREAAATINLSHENIVRIYSTGEDGGRRFIAMEYVEGPDLAAVIDREGPLRPPAAVRYLKQILSALDYAHGQGVIHKDIKPSNIMLTSLDPGGAAKLTDFGIARIVSDQILATHTLSIRGTLPYMSPQQVRGEPAAEPDDIYSLGITVYEMISGNPPFIRGDIAYQQAHSDPVPLAEAAKGVPDFLHRVVMRCLEKDPGRRYSRAREILADLEAAQA